MNQTVENDRSVFEGGILGAFCSTKSFEAQLNFCAVEWCLSGRLFCVWTNEDVPGEVAEQYRLAHRQKEIFDLCFVRFCQSMAL